MMFWRKRKRQVTPPATATVDGVDVVTRAEQILDDALMAMLFEAIDKCLVLLDDPRLPLWDADQVDAAVDQAFAVLDKVTGVA
jgi:hypothetical protein